MPNTMAGPLGTLSALRKPTAVTEILPGGSNLPSLPANAVLPPPDAASSSPRAVPEELTMEGDSPSSPALPSLPPGPQPEAEELVARYREGDRRAKERIGKKLLEDSRSPDTQVRMSAVWSMVQLQDVAFRRALTRCSNDDTKEIAKLAISGLDALGDVPSVE